MKRNQALVPLSHGHHHALAVALQLIRADESNLLEARKRFLGFMQTEGHRHFEIEETILLPFIADGIRKEDPDVARMLVEHRELRAMADALSVAGSPSASQLREVGALLQDHVRHEERVLFPRIEETLTSNRLLQLGVLLEDADDRFA